MPLSPFERRVLWLLPLGAVGFPAVMLVVRFGILRAFGPEHVLAGLMGGWFAGCLGAVVFALVVRRFLP